MSLVPYVVEQTIRGERSYDRKSCSAPSAMWATI